MENDKIKYSYWLSMNKGSVLHQIIEIGVCYNTIQ